MIYKKKKSWFLKIFLKGLTNPELYISVSLNFMVSSGLEKKKKVFALLCFLDFAVLETWT